MIRRQRLKRQVWYEDGGSTVVVVPTSTASPSSTASSSSTSDSSSSTLASTSASLSASSSLTSAGASSTSTLASNSPDNTTSSPVGPIVGIVIGALALVGFISFLLIRRRDSRSALLQSSNRTALRLPNSPEEADAGWAAEKARYAGRRQTTDQEFLSNATRVALGGGGVGDGHAGAAAGGGRGLLTPAGREWFRHSSAGGSEDGSVLGAGDAQERDRLTVPGQADGHRAVGEGERTSMASPLDMLVRGLGKGG